MISYKIKNLFHFIGYLHSNIENFKQYDNVLNKLKLLDIERQKVKLKKTFKDKLKYDDIQAEINANFKIVKENILQPIQAKVNELNICDLNKIETLWNWNINEINELKENFSKDDLPEIFSFKNKYLEYRTVTKGEGFFELSFFFDELDEILKELFDFFKETEQNEFEPFETKVKQLNDINEALEQFQHGFRKITFSSYSIPNQQTVKKSQLKQTDKPKGEQPEGKVIFTSSELALTYIFDLMAKGEQIPINRIEGGLNKKEIQIQGKKYISDNVDSLKFRKTDTFYREVKIINEKYDLNKSIDLNAISKDWINAISVLSNNWKDTKQYLIIKKLIEG